MIIRDGDWRLFDHDFQTGRSVWVMEDGNKTHWRIDYPVERLVEANTVARNDAGKGWKGDYHRIASIPQNVLYDENLGLIKAHEQGDDAYLSRWLNSSDNRAWRTKEGTV